MHFFWGGDMPRYSPPLPFRRGRAGCPCVLACPRGRPARVSRMCALAGVPRPAPRVAAMTCALAGGPAPVPGSGVPVRAGQRGVRGRTRWLARPGLSARPHTPLVATVPRFSPACAPLLAEFFNFLTDISV